MFLNSIKNNLDLKKNPQMSARSDYGWLRKNKKNLELLYKVLERITIHYKQNYEQFITEEENDNTHKNTHNYTHANTHAHTHTRTHKHTQHIIIYNMNWMS